MIISYFQLDMKKYAFRYKKGYLNNSIESKDKIIKINNFECFGKYEIFFTYISRLHTCGRDDFSEITNVHNANKHFCKKIWCKQIESNIITIMDHI